MAIPYVVRKKADLTSGERKELWYGVPSKIQDRGGVQNKELAQVVELRGGFHRGQVEGILVEVADAIRYLLSMGQSVTIDGLGTFQTALTSPGFERPEQVTPGQVSVSRVYFVANSVLRDRPQNTKMYMGIFALLYYIIMGIQSEPLKTGKDDELKSRTDG